MRIFQTAYVLKSGLELGLALAAGPLGNLAAEKADWPKELASRAGKALLEERNLKIYFRSCWGPWYEGSSRSYLDQNLKLYLKFYYMNLAPTLNKETIRTYPSI